MSPKARKIILVGDNPFHGISHLSDDRARDRGNEIFNAKYAAKLVMTSLENGANGFMFSVSEKTLSILRLISEPFENRQLSLYAIVPYAYEYVRLATKLGTVGLGKKLAGRVLLSGNLRAVASGLKGITTLDPASLLETYILYEISRIKSVIGKKLDLKSILLHEVVTDMALALDLKWLVKSYIHLISKLKIKPGFETRNFAYLVHKFKKWNIDFSKIVLVSSFNKVGFQMEPSKAECEKALLEIPECDVIAMSILAAGYIQFPEAIKYIETLPNLSGMVVGVSKEEHASETFSALSEKFLE